MCGSLTSIVSGGARNRVKREATPDCRPACQNLMIDHHPLACFRRGLRKWGAHPCDRLLHFTAARLAALENGVSLRVADGGRSAAVHSTDAVPQAQLADIRLRSRCACALKPPRDSHPQHSAGARCACAPRHREPHAARPICTVGELPCSHRVFGWRRWATRLLLHTYHMSKPRERARGCVNCWVITS